MTIFLNELLPLSMATSSLSRGSNGSSLVCFIFCWFVTLLVDVPIVNVFWDFFLSLPIPVSYLGLWFLPMWPLVLVWNYICFYTIYIYIWILIFFLLNKLDFYIFSPCISVWLRSFQNKFCNIFEELCMFVWAARASSLSLRVNRLASLAFNFKQNRISDYFCYN